jgi:hypothetical protein
MWLGLISSFEDSKSKVCSVLENKGALLQDGNITIPPEVSAFHSLPYRFPSQDHDMTSALSLIL